jgi:tetratricopeptide (TPR) repeat protein
MPLVCLNMIVKNEAAVIERCLASVKPHVDRWVIVDTGSSDGTQEIIRRAMAGVPGELHERPWVDFGHNRTEALHLAEGQGDYIFWLDADEEFFAPPGWTWPALEAEALDVDMLSGAIRYARVALVSTRLPWRWEGVLHEYLEAGVVPTRGRVEGVHILVRTEGARSRDPHKYLRDAEALEGALAKEPGNARYRFYLAQSWRDAGDRAKALANYDLRAEMGGWDEEVYIARLEGARCAEQLGRPVAEVVFRLLQAHQARPGRLEALVELARIHRQREEHHLGHLFAHKALELPPCEDRLFVEPLAAWRALDEGAVAAYWTGRMEECRRLCEAALADPLLPPAEAGRVQGNLAFALKALGLPSSPLG